MLPHSARACCCCGCAGTNGTGGAAEWYNSLSPEDQDFLDEALHLSYGQTGRLCQNFFATLRDPQVPGEELLGGKPTMLAFIGALPPGAYSTLCAVIERRQRRKAAFQKPPRLQSEPLFLYEVYRFEVSGFGFARPILGTFPTREIAEAAVERFRSDPSRGVLEGAAIREIRIAG